MQFQIFNASLKTQSLPWADTSSKSTIKALEQRPDNVLFLPSNSHLISIKNNMTITQAELIGFLLIELFLSVYHTLKSIFAFLKTFFCIDSSGIVLEQILFQYKIHKPYVQRRLEKMRDVTIDFGKQLEFAYGRLDPRYCNKGCYTSSAKVL